MSVRDQKAWMPKDMLDSDKDYFVSCAPTDPHLAAALAWEAWASNADDEPAVREVWTGVQKVQYARGNTPFQTAMDRAAWHRSRAKIQSVAVGPKYEISESLGSDGFDYVQVREDGTRHRMTRTEDMTPWWEQTP
jgi:hypothetical protein